jgi:chemotaxis protein CheC
MKISNLQKDALKELVSMASGNASSSISDAIGKSIKMEVPLIDIVPIDKISTLLGGHKKLIVGIISRITGEMNGTMMLVLPKNNAMLFSDVILKRRKGSTKCMDNKANSAFSDIGDMVMSSYIDVFKNFLGFEVSHGKPNIISAFGESLADFILVKAKNENSILLKSHFSVTGTKISGDFILFMEIRSLSGVLKALEGISDG